MTLALAASAAYADVILLRNGSSVAGPLKSCDDEQCTAGGRRIPLSEIARIELTEGPAIPSTARANSVVMTDGTVRNGAFVGLNLGYVWFGDEEVERGDVAAIVFEEVKPVLPATPQPSSVAQETPSSAAPTPASRLPTQPAPRTASKLVLNEVLFLPQPQQSTFVELRNTTPEPLPLTRTLPAKRKRGHRQASRDGDAAARGLADDRLRRDA